MQDKKKILLVEGYNDKGVIEQVLNAYGINVDIEIKVCKGVDGMPDELRLHLKNPSAYSAVAVIADADTNTDSRWQQIRNILHNTGMYDCNRLPLPPEGAVLASVDSDISLKAGAWIMPINEYPGALVEFLIEMIPIEDELMVEVENKLMELESQCKQRYAAKDRNKAKVQTYTAWERKPGISVATAVKSRILNPHTPTADKFVEWIKEVFVNE